MREGLPTPGRDAQLDRTELDHVLRGQDQRTRRSGRGQRSGGQANRAGRPAPGCHSERDAGRVHDRAQWGHEPRHEPWHESGRYRADASYTGGSGPGGPSTPSLPRPGGSGPMAGGTGPMGNPNGGMNPGAAPFPGGMNPGGFLPRWLNPGGDPNQAQAQLTLSQDRTLVLLEAALASTARRRRTGWVRRSIRSWRVSRPAPRRRRLVRGSMNSPLPSSSTSGERHFPRGTVKRELTHDGSSWIGRRTSA